MFHITGYALKVLLRGVVLLATIPVVSGSALNARENSQPQPTPTPHGDFKAPVNMGTPINSQANEFAPSFTKDGKTLVFNSRKGGSRYQNLYTSRLQSDGKWSTPRALQVLNSPYNDETPQLSPKGDLIIFSSDRDGSLEMPRNRLGQVKVSYDLYWSRKVEGRWSKPVKIPGAVHTMSHERSPSMDYKTGTLYYSSWPFGDIRRARLMSADYRNGRFINPRPLPAQINDGHIGLAPVFSPEKGGLYFSSNRPGGHGGWDIYFAPIKAGTFGAPVNLGPKINSPRHELFFTNLGKNIYLCSNRAGGKGRYDIYRTGEAEKDKELLFTVLDKKTKKALKTGVRLEAKVVHDGKEISSNIQKESDIKGTFKLVYNPLVKKVEVVINKDGYQPFRKFVDLDNDAPDARLLELEPLKKDGSFNVYAIRFNYDSAVIKAESFKYLNDLADYLKENEHIKVAIIGHTDLNGSVKYNLKLSLQRAASVRDYLIKRGLAPARFRIKGAGMSRPLVPKKGPQFDQRNRRTEFRLTKSAGSD